MFKYILIGLIFSHSIARSQESDETVLTHEREKIIEALKTLSSEGCYIIGQSAEPTVEEKIKLKTLMDLSFLSVEDLRDLSNSDNPYTKVYAFNALCMYHSNAVNEDDLKILNDSSKILFCSKDKPVDLGLTVGSLSMESYNQIAYLKDVEIKKQEVEKIIQEFILAYAKFPESYSPIEFTDYIIGSTLNDEEKNKSYEMLHTYSIKDNNGEVKEFSHYFILRSDLSINLIEVTRSNKAWVNTPELQVWLDSIGRTLTKKDRKKLGLE